MRFVITFIVSFFFSFLPSATEELAHNNSCVPLLGEKKAGHSWSIRNNLSQ